MLPQRVVSAIKTKVCVRGGVSNCAERILLVSFLLTFSVGVCAQSGEGVVPVTLGQSVVALTGPWRFHVGDDPRWADPAFDDSQWETVDLTPTAQTTLRSVEAPGFVSGWEARGHSGYAGFAWYRMRVRISGAGGPLTLLSPEWFNDGFQIFVNGDLVGSFGDFTRPLPVLYFSNPAMFTLPAGDVRADQDGTTLIAFRFYMAAASLGHQARGGMHGPPRIGLPAAATAVYRVEWEKEYRRLVSALAAALMYFFLTLLIAMIFAFSRADKILLWPLAACVLYMVSMSLIFSTNAHWMSQVKLQSFIALARTSGWYVWMLTWWAYFGLQRRRWLFYVIVVLGVVDLVESVFFVAALQVGRASHGLMVSRSFGDLSISVTSFLVMAAIGYFGWRGAERGKWPLFLALFFSAVQNLEPLLNLLHVRTSWRLFGVLFPYDFLCTGAMLFCFSIVLFRQFRSSLQRQQSIAEDLKQAQEVQQLLIPDQLSHVHGWTIESEYQPAREVGGDFFQIIPHPSDGSILIVAGDVAGKGLQAGMMVALLLGAIRTESEHTFDPIQILKSLNSRLIGRERAQATCVALYIQEDGAATLANAGHLPPYLSGVEISIEGSLPLGMIADAEFPTLRFDLEPGDRLILISDGIVEAQNEHGDLFGFDRIRSLVSKQASTTEIANTAKAFGQQDDISVLSIVRTPVMIGVAG